MHVTPATGNSILSQFLNTQAVCPLQLSISVLLELTSVPARRFSEYMECRSGFQNCKDSAHSIPIDVQAFKDVSEHI